MAYNLFLSAGGAEPGLLEFALNAGLLIALAIAMFRHRHPLVWVITQLVALAFIFGSVAINFYHGGEASRVLLWMPWLAIVYLQNAGTLIPRRAIAASAWIFLASLAVLAPYVITGVLAPGMPAFDAVVVMVLLHLALIVMLFAMARRIAVELTARIRMQAALEAAQSNARVEAELAAARLKLARADRSLSVSALAETIAHEIKQPLTSISTAAQAALNWLKHDRPSIEEATACNRRILDDARRAGEIVISTRDLIRREHGVRAPVDVGALIAEVATILRDETTEKGVDLTTDAADGLPRIAADAGQIRQMLMNIVINAIEASRSNAPGARPVTILANGTEHFVVIAVEDRGVGFVNGGEKRAFEPFYTTRPGGIGLGLPICRTIAEAHGGSVEAEALPRGARVSVTLPAASG